uniref:uncharacterized protein LOC120336698 n=1 Tax=Styela clava TaxID=7725 RepID=UPI00193AC95B|nr:uncharacterized protein LOC120336698 [Styela clava]
MAHEKASMITFTINRSVKFTFATLAGASVGYALWKWLGGGGEEGKPKSRRRKKTVPGLLNVGNSCFMNALLQCFATCPAFVEWLKNFVERVRIDTDHVYMADVLLKIIEILTGDTELQDYYFDPSELLQDMGGRGWQISSQEQDTHEFFHALMTTLLEEYHHQVARDTRPLQIFEVKELLSKSSPSSGITRVARFPVKDCYTQPSSSPCPAKTSDPPFRGTLACVLQCQTCGFQNPIRYDGFDSLSLPLPSGPSWSMQTSLLDCLKNFTAPEVIKNVECQNCSTRQGKGIPPTAGSYNNNTKEIKDKIINAHPKKLDKKDSMSKSTDILVTDDTQNSSNLEITPSETLLKSSNEGAVEINTKGSIQSKMESGTLWNDKDPVTSKGSKIASNTPSHAELFPKGRSILNSTNQGSDSELHEQNKISLTEIEKGSIKSSLNTQIQTLSYTNSETMLTGTNPDNKVEPPRNDGISSKEMCKNSQNIQSLRNENVSKLNNDSEHSSITDNEQFKTKTGYFTTNQAPSSTSLTGNGLPDETITSADNNIKPQNQENVESDNPNTSLSLSPTHTNKTGLPDKTIQTVPETMPPVYDCNKQSTIDISPTTQNGGVGNDKNIMSNAKENSTVQNQNGSLMADNLFCVPDPSSIVIKNVGNFRKGVHNDSIRNIAKSFKNPFPKVNFGSQRKKFERYYQRRSRGYKFDGENEYIPTKRNFIRRMCIGKLPDCLCMHLQRLVWIGGMPTKKMNFVKFPEILDMGQFTELSRITSLKKRQNSESIEKQAGQLKPSEMLEALLKKRQQRLESLPMGLQGGSHRSAASTTIGSHKALYRLTSAIVHIGDSSFCGHFFTYRRSPDKDNEWVCASDTLVRKATQEEVMNCPAYMLFYERIKE